MSLAIFPVDVSDTIKLSSPATQEFWEIPIAYEDDSLLALNKPARLLSSPDRYDPTRPNLMRLLHTGIAEGKSWATRRNLIYLMNAHRLDFETSGIILLAKTKPILVALANLFGTDKPKKSYVALVRGIPASETWTVNAALAPHPNRPQIIRVDPKRGKKSRTAFHVRESFGSYALIDAHPVTGRTHQIRVHLRHCGLPICGDSQYGGRPLRLSQLKRNYRLKPGHTERPLIDSVALHAEKLELQHPVNGSTVSIVAEWPKDLRVAVNYLRRYKRDVSTDDEPAGEFD